VHVEQNILKAELNSDLIATHSLLSVFFKPYCATFNCLLFDKVTDVFTAGHSICNTCESVAFPSPIYNIMPMYQCSNGQTITGLL
jgi:hypothetical protein